MLKFVAIVRKIVADQISLANAVANGARYQINSLMDEYFFNWLANVIANRRIIIKID